MRDIFELEPVEFPTTRKLGASKEERAEDLISAFEDKEIKGVISSLGGDNQITYVKNLPKEPVYLSESNEKRYSDMTEDFKKDKNIFSADSVDTLFSQLNEDKVS